MAGFKGYHITDLTPTQGGRHWALVCAVADADEHVGHFRSPLTHVERSTQYLSRGEGDPPQQRGVCETAQTAWEGSRARRDVLKTLPLASVCRARQLPPVLKPDRGSLRRQRYPPPPPPPPRLLLKPGAPSAGSTDPPCSLGHRHQPGPGRETRQVREELRRHLELPDMGAVSR